MTKKFFVSLALMAGMVSPALAEETHTINVWGTNFEVPYQPSQPFETYVVSNSRAPLPAFAAGTHTIDVWGSDFQVPNRSAQ
jgi:hypothetical protein